MPTQAEYDALLAAQRQTAARTEALELRLAHLEGTVVGQSEAIAELTTAVARITAHARQLQLPV